jgi:lipopolysaccharide export system protein LptC
MKRILRVAWERLSLYLPVILMGVLALGTYWLVRSTPMDVPPAPDAPVSSEPDYFMRRFSVRTFDQQGKLKSEMLGDQARHLPDRDVMEIDGVRMRSFDASGVLTTASAQRAQAQGDGSMVQLWGDARVVQEAQAGRQRLAFKGEQLHADTRTHTVRSTQPVELSRGNDRFTADALEFDSRERVVQLSGRVRAELTPQTRR